MIVSECGVVTDHQKRQLKAFGSPQFPVYCAEVDLGTTEIPWHWHDEPEVDFLAAGRACLWVDGAPHSLTPGEGIFVNAGALHRVQPDGPESRLRAIVFHPRLVGGSLESVFWQDYLRPLTEDSARPCLRLGDGEEWRREAMETVLTAWEACAQEEPGYEFAVREALSRMVFLLSRAPSRKPPSEKALREMERLKEMLQFIQANYSQPVTVAQIAQSASVSESECLRCFRNGIGTSPIQYVNQYRVQRAAELLASTDRKITDIAGLCGFQEMSYFARTFRNLKGLTPSAYRRQRKA